MSTQLITTHCLSRSIHPTRQPDRINTRFCSGCNIRNDKGESERGWRRCQHNHTLPISLPISLKKFLSHVDGTWKRTCHFQVAQTRYCHVDNTWNARCHFQFACKRNCNWPLGYFVVMAWQLALSLGWARSVRRFAATNPTQIIAQQNKQRSTVN
jgi:hypothetical protein